MVTAAVSPGGAAGLGGTAALQRYIMQQPGRQTGTAETLEASLQSPPGQQGGVATNNVRLTSYYLKCKAVVSLSCGMKYIF